MSFETDETESNDQNVTSSTEQEGSFSSEEEGVVIGEEKPQLNRGTLAMFAIICLGAAGLYGMYRKAGPSAANASMNQETVEANKTITTFLSGGDSSIKSMHLLLKNTEKIVQTFLTYPSTTQVPLSDLRTNPFKQFTDAPKPAATADSGLSEAADRKKREEERQNVLKAVQAMQLQSIMFSEARSVCMIDSTMYREGQTIGDFTLEKISPTSVIVKNGPYRFELRIQR